jgi:ubiquinone/menaquinone biosynthesis C-methylase UbiE
MQLNEKERLRQHFFDERAAHWEAMCYPPEVRAELEKLLEHFDLKSGTRVLDVGCGVGVLVPYLRRYLGEDGEIIELDQSKEMLNYAAMKERKNLTCLWAGVESIPLIDEYVDEVICFSCFPHFSDKAKAVAECARVLKSGGQFIIAHLADREELHQIHGGCEAVAHDVMPNDEELEAMIEAANLTLTHFEEFSGRFLVKAQKKES